MSTKAKETPEPTLDPVQQALEMQGMLDTLRGNAVAQLLDEIKDRQEKLKSLGWQAGPERRPGGVSSTNPCRVCGKMGHDARSHRGDGKKVTKITRK